MTVPENFSGFRVRIGSRRDEVVVTFAPKTVIYSREGKVIADVPLQVDVLLDILRGSVRYIWPDPQQCADFVREAIEEKIARKNVPEPWWVLAEQLEEVSAEEKEIF